MHISPLGALRSILQENHIDAFWITNFHNILYTTGFKTLSPDEREASVIITSKSTYLISDGRYLDDVHIKLLVEEGYIPLLLTYENKLPQHLQEIIAREGISVVGFEEEDLKYVEFKKLAEIHSVKTVPLSNIILKIRAIKSAQEYDTVKQACRITDNCLTELKSVIKVGMTEKELAWKIEKWLREHDADIAFYPIIAVDEHAAIPHYDTETGNSKIQKGSIVLMDFGAKVDGYNADITRMLSVGQPSAEFINAYGALLAAQEKTIQQIKPDKNCQHLDNYCRQLLHTSGFPDYMHGTGHGVGLEVHEFPKVSPASTDIFKKGHVFTVEPGIYYSGKFGLRIEDTVGINNQGDVELMTLFPKKLLTV